MGQVEQAHPEALMPTRYTAQSFSKPKSRNFNTFEFSVSASRLVPSLRIAEAVLLPRAETEGDTLLDRFEQDSGVAETREIQVLREVLPNLAHSDTVFSPQRDAVQLLPQADGPELCD